MTLINDTLNFEINLTGDGDLWGWALGWHFSIAEILYADGEDIPADWQYRHPMPASDIDTLADSEDSPYEESILANLYRDGTVTADELRYAGTVLMRYCGLLKALDFDY